MPKTIKFDCRVSTEKNISSYKVIKEKNIKSIKQLYITN